MWWKHVSHGQMWTRWQKGNGGWPCTIGVELPLPVCPRVRTASKWLVPLDTTSLSDLCSSPIALLTTGSFWYVSYLSPICCLLLNQLGLLQQLLPDSLQRLTALLCLLLQKIQHLFLPALNAIHHHCSSTVNLPHARDLILKRPLFLLHNLHPPHHGFHLPWQLHHCLAKMVDWFCFLNLSLQIKTENCAMRMPFLAKLTIFSSVRLVLETTSAILNFPSKPLRAMSVSASWSLMLDTEVNCGLGSKFKLTPRNYFLLFAILTKSPSLDQCKHQKVDHCFAHWPLSHTKWFVPQEKIIISPLKTSS